MKKLTLFYINYYKIFYFAFAFLLPFSVSSFGIDSTVLNTSDSTNKTPELNIHIRGYVEAYYSNNLNHNSSTILDPRLVSYNRHNLLGINLAFIEFAIEHKDNKRAVLSLHSGNYVDDNYTGKDSSLKTIREAYIGYKFKNKNLWLDAGVFNSYIGAESSIGAENPTLTRSLIAELSPYYLTGLKLSYQKNKLEAGIMLHTGWQTIVPAYSKTLPSFGTFLKYKVKKLEINHSTFFDIDKESEKKYFSNLYLDYPTSKKGKLMVNFDIGITSPKAYPRANYWYGTAIIYQHLLHKRISVTGRIENYYDPSGINAAYVQGNVLDCIGGSANLDLKLSQRSKLRMEYRYLHNQKPNFYTNNNWSNSLSFFSLSLFAKFY
jgi:hypothetical protein